jgi:organic radical activating enzyme
MSLTRVGRTVRRFFDKALGLHVRRFLYESGLGKSLFLDEEGRVRIRKLEIYLTKGCNLKCRYCSHFNPYRRGIVSTETLIGSMETWSTKVSPKKFGLLGGEPLLHPDINLIVKKARECWSKTHLILTTNGLLLSQKGKSLLDMLLETRTQVLLSEHLTDQEGIAALEKGRQMLKEAGVPTIIIPSASRWKEYYLFSDEGKPLPYKSRPESAWTMCGPNTCFNLTENKLYRCSILANAAQAWQEGALRQEWNVTESYSPLTPDASADEIVRHLFLMKGPLEACSICPEKIRFVDSRQIALDSLSHK